MGENEHSKAVSRTAGAGREIQREADAKTRQGSGHNGGSEKKPVQSGPRDFCALIGGQPYRAGNSRQCHRARPGLDASQPRRPTGRRRRQVWRFYADEAAGPARGNRTRLRVSRGAVLLKLYHGRNPPHHWRLRVNIGLKEVLETSSFRLHFSPIAPYGHAHHQRGTMRVDPALTDERELRVE